MPSNFKLNFWTAYPMLWELCEDNYAYFNRDESAFGQKLFLNIGGIMRNLEKTKTLANEIQNFAHEYDFRDTVPANGYRSFLRIAECCLESVLDLLLEITKAREHGFFQKSKYIQETLACEMLLSNVCSCLQYILTLRKCSDHGDLFPNDSFSTKQLFAYTQSIDHACFYGNRLGFQYCLSMRKALCFIVSCMAGFSHLHYSQSGATCGFLASLWNGCKYHLNPESRSKKVSSLILEADVGFCKAFWLLAESKFMQTYSFVVRSPVQINRVITIPPELLTYVNKELDFAVQIPIPSSHFGPTSISVRLISSKHRKGMIGEFAFTGEVFPAADSIVIHCHGGGFVAQSSKSHEIYLCEWAVQLDVPILSIDYSLTPQAPYPRALEEVFYTYCWVLKNLDLLGSKGKKIILAGDSAGANLCISTSLKCIQHGVRKPDGLFVAYCPVLIGTTPSPARLLSLMDPLVPFGFLRQCLEAYVTPLEKIKEENTKQAEARINLVESVLNSKSSSTQHCAKHIQCQEHSANKTNGLNGLCTDTSTKLSNSKRMSIPEFLPTLVNEIYLGGNYLFQSIEKALFKDKYILALANHLSISKNKFQHWARTQKWKELLASTNFMPSRHLSNGHSHATQPFQNSCNEMEYVVPSDPFMSPYLAPLDDLKQLPSTNILSIEMDPCLDDCVMFAKKLDLLGVKVNLDVVQGLPHGFLNLVKLSKEAGKGSQLCIQRIRELLFESIV